MNIIVDGDLMVANEGDIVFIEAFDLLRSVPTDIVKLIREGGGVSDWLYKGGKSSAPSGVSPAPGKLPT